MFGIFKPTEMPLNTEPPSPALAAKMEKVREINEEIRKRAERIGERRALEMLKGKITLGMIDAAGKNPYRIHGVPVTEEQHDLLLAAFGFTAVNK